MIIAIEHLCMLPQTVVKVTELPLDTSTCGIAISENL